MEFIEYPDREILIPAVADKLAATLKNALLAHEKVSFAVPGGTTPGPIFDAMSAASLDWDRVSVMLTDERWVPDTHERSNAGLVKSRLLQGQAQAAHFIPFYVSGKHAAEAATQVSEELDELFPLALVLLGMGADMHTASLFPAAVGLKEALDPSAPALCAIETPTQPETRISLSAPVLNGAMEKHLVIFGQDKRDALEQALQLPPEQAPIGAVIKEGTVHWAA